MLSHLAPHVRLINRQVKTEAELQAGKCVSLIVRDGSRTRYPKPLTRNFSDRCLSVITSFEFSFLALFGLISNSLSSLEIIHEEISGQIAVQQEWLEESVQGMANLRRFEVEVQMEWPVGFDLEWTQILYHSRIRRAMDSITDMPGLTQMRIRKLERNIAQLAILDNKLRWEWNKDKGWHTPPDKFQPSAAVRANDEDE